MLRQKLQDDQIVALKSGDKTKLEIHRSIIIHLIDYCSVINHTTTWK